MNNRNLQLFWFVFLFYFSIFAFAKEKPHEKTNLAVADFAGKNVSAADASIVTDFLRIEIVNIGIYNVVEKANMDKILAEARFQLTGCTEAECAVQIGKILNVQKMVIGSLSKLMDVYYITASLVDVQTGKILKADRVEALSARELPNATKELTEKLTEQKITVRKEVPKPKEKEKKEEKVAVPEQPIPEKIKGPVITKEGVKFFYKGKAKEVFLAGSFNNWLNPLDGKVGTVNPEYILKDTDKDGVWELVVKLVPGSYQYKFIVDGNWVHDEKNPETADDGLGGKNSVLEISKKTYKKVGLTGPVITKKGVKFLFISSSASKVYLKGSFNDWSATADPMINDSSGNWTIIKKLPKGKHYYKFAVGDSNFWTPDYSNPNMEDDGYGGVNSVIEVK